jgi:CheY-like chemotaxis protein
MRCILAVDDEELFLQLAHETLSTLGHDVLLAHTGEEGVHKLRKYRDIVEMVFLDVLLPDMSGVDVIRHMREIHPEIPIVVVTGDPEHPQVSDMMGYHPAGVVGKPFNLMQLEQTITSILGDR